jgi:hypothetical protein
MSTIILIAIILGPLVLLTLLKVNAVFVYLGLCLGAVVSEYVSTNSQVNNLVASNHIISQYFSSNGNLKIGLLLLPPILITLFMLGSAKGKKLSLNLLPSLAVGLLAVFLVVPLLPFSSAESILTSTIWIKLRDAQSEIVGLSAVVVIFVLLLQRSHLVSSGGHRKHHK